MSNDKNNNGQINGLAGEDDDQFNPSNYFQNIDVQHAVDAALHSVNLLHGSGNNNNNNNGSNSNSNTNTNSGTGIGTGVNGKDHHDNLIDEVQKSPTLQSQKNFVRSDGNGSSNVGSGSGSLDLKKVCPFCGKYFSHPGSLGRHLDLKKGTDLHPIAEIMKIRSDVQRRSGVDNPRARKRRNERARIYNQNENVKIKNRKRRKLQDRKLKAEKLAMVNFLSKLGKPSLQQHPSFPRMVLYFLPPSKWPHDPPTLETFRTLKEYLNNQQLLDTNTQYAIQSSAEHSNDVELRLANLQNEISSKKLKKFQDYQEKLSTAFENWLSLSNDAKLDIWIREQRQCAQDALGISGLSLYNLANRSEWLVEEQQKLFQSYLKILKQEEEEEEEGEEADLDEERESTVNTANRDSNSDDDSPNYYSNHQLTAGDATLEAVAAAINTQQRQDRSASNNTNNNNNKDNNDNDNDNHNDNRLNLDPELMNNVRNA
ncbi:hypothetical protein PACTADRAFT_50651 [Pachysolen tannophilus NRRL Y-2460]|uniref:C2H2-type domain-containing protein n=1 Tax=Pachysolen tannophilus NRRL Y-2460 TaxID=669874 RepID=A0A1E4TSR4_PACTA|nr:hypothetical protein PACTADRAFT_50651 [Pachysolen tannophilus NRRL Y-2460]